MKPLVNIGVHVSALLLATTVATAHAVDLSDAIVLVARPALDRTPFEQTVVIAAPAPGGMHVGFVVNRPSQTKLELLFPDQETARDVVEPVYLGGPTLSNGLFALVRDAPANLPYAIPLLPGLVAVFDATAIDHLMEENPNGARYFVGMMQWDAGELEQQVANGLWEVRAPDLQTVLPAKARGLWNSLRSPMASVTWPHAIAG